MDLTAETIQKVIDITKPEIEKVGELTYAIRPGSNPVNLQTIKDLDFIKLTTLTGVVDYLNENPDGLTMKDIFIRVTSHQKVVIESKIKDRNRDLILVSEFSSNQFRFGESMAPEPFIIGLRSQFKQDENTALLIKIAGNLESVLARSCKDDGISQAVVVRTAVNKENVEVPGLVTLKPYRTFSEIEQPASEFLFRLEEGPKAKLVEADGGAWKNAAMQSIKKYLADKLPGMMILA